MIDFTIDTQDLRILFLKTSSTSFSKAGFENFVKECAISYTTYFNRNKNNIKEYGLPKTYANWVNGQIIALN
jgi:hypothetical protein